MQLTFKNCNSSEVADQLSDLPGSHVSFHDDKMLMLGLKKKLKSLKTTYSI